MQKTKLISHRGLSSEAPENTLASFRLACEAGTWGVECDIYETADGHFVITHDDTLTRMCGVDVCVKNQTLAEIQSHRIIAGNNVESFPDEVMPSLEEYLKLLSQYSGIHPVIELKDERVSTESLKRLADTVKEYFACSDVWFISFFGNLLLSLKKIEPEFHYQYLFVDGSEENLQFCIDNNMDADMLCLNVTEEITKRLHAHNLKVNVWTVNKKESADYLSQTVEVDYITSNYIFL